MAWDHRLLVGGDIISLLSFIGEAVRDAFDPNKAVSMTQTLLAIENLSVGFRHQQPYVQ